MNEFVTTPEAAKFWHCSQQAVNARIQRGTLPAIRMGKIFLIRKSDLERYHTGRGRQ